MAARESGGGASLFREKIPNSERLLSSDFEEADGSLNVLLLSNPNRGPLDVNDTSSLNLLLFRFSLLSSSFSVDLDFETLVLTLTLPLASLPLRLRSSFGRSLVEEDLL